MTKLSRRALLCTLIGAAVVLGETSPAHALSGKKLPVRAREHFHKLMDQMDDAMSRLDRLAKRARKADNRRDLQELLASARTVRQMMQQMYDAKG